MSLKMPTYGIYGYCVILCESSLDFEKVTMGTCNSNVHTINYQDIAMVVSKAPFILPPKRENVFAHQEVINRVTESFTVLPLSFGNVFRSEKDIMILLEKLSDQVHELVPRLENKIEMGLIISGNKEWFDKEIESDQELVALKKSLNNMAADAGFYERIRGGEVARHFFERLQQQVIKGIYNPLAEVADSAKLNEPVGDRALLNAAFLINKEDESLFDRKVMELYDFWKEKMDFKYNGPWPAYNFVNIRLTVE